MEYFTGTIHTDTITFVVTGIANVPNTPYYLLWSESGQAQLLDMTTGLAQEESFILDFSGSHKLLQTCRYFNGDLYLLTVHMETLPGDVKYIVHHKVTFQPSGNDHNPFVKLHRTGVIDLNKKYVTDFGDQHMPHNFNIKQLTTTLGHVHSSRSSLAIKPNHCLFWNKFHSTLIMTNPDKIAAEPTKQPVIKPIHNKNPTNSWVTKLTSWIRREK